MKKLRLLITILALFATSCNLDTTGQYIYHSPEEIVGALGESHVKAQANLTDRTEALKQIKTPTFVIHGEQDYLVDKYGDIQTADSIINTELLLIPEIGYLPFN